MKTALFCLFATSAFDLISAVTPQPRFGHGCVLLKQKIYCYGGGQYVSGATNYNTVYNDHFALDLSQSFVVGDSQDAWTSIPAPSDFILEPNYKYGIAPINATSYMITSGSGYNDNKTPLKNKTTVYHVDQDQWVSIPTTANQSIGVTLNFANGKGYLFGGIQTYTNIIPNRNLLTIDLNAIQWAQSPLGPGTTLRTDHASAMDNNSVIYYTGGHLGSPSGGVYTWTTNVPMTSITTYDTKSLTWGTIAVSGTAPTLRNSHSFTYLPKDDQFVLFGGKQGQSETPGSFDDICYTFDPKGKMWTRKNVTQIGGGSRFGHSAVLYKDFYLFIIFGGDQGTMTLSDFKVLNLQDWSWASQFNPNGLPNNNGGGTNGSGNATDDGTIASSNSISGGAIAGIVIGVLAAIGIAIGAFFFLRRRRNNNSSSNNNKNQEQASERKPRDDFEMDQEFEVPPAPRYFSQTAQNFITAGNNKTNLGQSPLDQQQPQDNRVFHPDEMSTSTAPTYTSATPIMVSPSSPVSTTVVGSDPGSRQRQYKPDLTMDTADNSFGQEPVKPHGLH